MAGWKLPLDVHRDGLPTVAIYISGILSLLGLASNVAHFLLPYLRPSKLHRYLHETDGKPAWALVTGATDGIGKQFSHELASHGFNVVLHGRNPTKLAAVHDELAATFPSRRFRSLVADAHSIPCSDCRHRAGSGRTTTAASAGERTPVDFDALAASLADINLTVVVNNAGAAPTDPLYRFVHESGEATLVDNVNLNAVFPLLLQAKLLPQLLRDAPGLVLNVGSFAENGLPMVAAYAASKTFVGTLGRIIPNELGLLGRRGDVEVLNVRVGETTLTSINSDPVSLFEPAAGTVARAALARVGCGRPAVVAYFPHALQQAVMDLLPRSVREKVFQDVIRTRWMAEQDRRKKGT